MERRRALVTAGGLFPMAISGCVSRSSEPEDLDEDDPPDPVVEDVRIPAVEHVDRNGMPLIEPIDEDADSALEFAGTFENAGDAGDAVISLYLLEADGTDESALVAGAPARGTVARFAAGERREIVFDDVSPQEYDAYFLEAQIGSVEADVRNDGEAGKVEVVLTGPGGQRADERRTVEIDADGTETISFDGPFMRESYDVRAEPVDE
ncbi:hypothetical protein [Halobiforma nitratireducens]|uniref:Lipoprotein n=1 Tax=Halobiforma nitratireducens JCM 10879 TaxID=1227454 RepID=M0LE83_9EURY|nr:hypothetical protein [Halobiforma nitratireducens]EMA31886.1 hypothetical protein C446_15221 [Halobiforma nitratireducens JCM 10879]